MREYLKQQIEARQSAWHAAKALLDAAAADKRELTAEEEQSYTRMMADIDARSQKIADLEAAAQREADIEASLRNAPDVRTEAAPAAVESDADMLRRLVNGEMRSYTFERRDSSTSSAAGIVPQGFYAVIQENLQYAGPMMDESVVTVLRTASGEDIKVPVETSRAASTAIAEGTSITATDPSLTSLTLKSQKVAVLVKVSRELLQDSGIDLVAYLGRSLGASIGIRANGLLTVGTGTVQANGIVTASGSGVTGTATGGAFSADELIDLAHAIDSDYIRRGAAWQARRTTLGAMRKLKDSAGYYLFQPAATVGTPDTLLGFPIFENPDVPAIGSAAKSVTFGWNGSYHTRMVGGIEVARSDDAYFAEDEVGFRATLRFWGDLGQAGAVKHFIGKA